MNECYATMPKLAHAHISSLGYLCMHRPEKVVVMVFAIGSCIYQFFVIVRRHLVRILSTF